MMTDEQKQVRQYCAWKGIKPYQLADMAGVSRPTIYRLLNGACLINLSSWRKIKKVMDDGE